MNFYFQPGKPLGRYLGNWDKFIGCQALFKNEEVTIHSIEDRYVNVIHNETGQIWNKVHTMSLIPLEYNEDK